MKRVALIMGMSEHFDHSIARGIIRYARESGDWQLHGRGWMFSPMDELYGWDGDGIIVRKEYLDRPDHLKKFPGPVVDIANAFRSPGVQTVCNDDVRTGVLAGKHFTEKGYRSLAYCGASGTLWSSQRYSGFCAETGQSDIPKFERPLAWWLEVPYSAELGEFLSGLAKPAAVFACNDKTALRVSSACSVRGISMPDELALLGVDNEEIPCELSSPRLSSIELRLDHIGYTAAGQLDRLMTGQSQTADAIQIAPAHVIERESTAGLGSGDALISRAYRVLQSPGGCRHNVKSLAGQLNISRRTLENHFTQHIGMSAHELIVSQRIRLALQLLLTSNSTLESISLESGFGSVQTFLRHFRSQYGTTPDKYRKQMRS